MFNTKNARVHFDLKIFMYLSDKKGTIIFETFGIHKTYCKIEKQTEETEMNK